MGLLNNFQLAKGARTHAGSKTYVTALIKDKGSYAASGSAITFSNLQIELDGQLFNQTSTLDFSTLGTAVVPGQTYGVYAVPQYNEPTSPTAAEALGLDYYVAANPNGESIAYRFFNLEVTAALAAAGGIAAIGARVLGGVGSTSDITLYNYYYENVEKYRDPRYTVQVLKPIGFNFVLGTLQYIDNSAVENAFFTKTYTQFQQLISQLGQIRTLRQILTASAATTKYTGFLHLISSAKSYGSNADALVDNNGTDITPAIQAALAAGTAYTFASGTYVAVNEFTLPSTNDIGQTFVGYAVDNWIDIQTSSNLGRINPIYLDNQSLISTVRIAKPALSRLTYFSDPCSLVNVTLGGTSGSLTIPSISSNFSTGFF